MPITIGLLIKYIGEELQRRGNANLKDLDLTFSQYVVLLELDARENKQAYLKDLEKRMRVAQSTAAGIVARLEKKGYVESLATPEDRRVKLIRLTALGQDRCIRTRIYSSKDENSMLSQLSPEEKETLITLLRKLDKGLQEEP